MKLLSESIIYDKSEELRNHIQSSFSDLLNNLKKECIPEQYKIKKFVSIGQTFSGTNQIELFDMAKLIENEFDKICKLSTYSAMYDKISTIDLIISHSKLSSSSIEDEIALIIKILLITYLDKTQSFDFNDAVLKEVSFALTKYLKDDPKILHCYIPIYGLTGDFSQFDINDRISIRRRTSMEFDNITNLDLYNYKFVDRRYSSLQYVLDVKFPHENIQVNEISFPVLDSLRLLKTGKLHLGAAYPYVSGLKGVPIRSKIGHENPPEPDMPLELNSHEFQEFLSIFDNLNHLRSEFGGDGIRYINVGIRRFGKSYEDKFVEDRITDLAIALETLLNKESFEITLRLSLNAALLLGSDEEEREFLYKFINRCYAIRSEIVHGKERTTTKIMGKSYTDDQVADVLEQKTRDAIKIIIQLHKKFKSQDNLLSNLMQLVVNRNKTSEFFRKD